MLASNSARSDEFCDGSVGISPASCSSSAQRVTASSRANALLPEVVLYTIYARACDPVPAFLKAGGRFSDAQIVDWVLGICLNGLRGR